MLLLATSAELPHDCTELMLYPELSAPHIVPLQSSKNHLNSHREIKGTLLHKGGKRTISYGLECHFWYDLSLDLKNQQPLAAARIWNSKGDWRTSLFLGASRIRPTERLREGSARKLLDSSMLYPSPRTQLPSFQHYVCTQTQTKCANRILWYHITHSEF